MSVSDTDKRKYPQKGTFKLTMIYHHTHSERCPSITSTMKIWLEATTLENYIKQGSHLADINGYEMSTRWKECKKSFKLVGRYVWFTEEQMAYTIGYPHLPKTSFAFDSTTINAVRWTDVCKSMLHKNQRKEINYLNAKAKAAGDDFKKWWVCKSEVSLEQALGIVVDGKYHEIPV